MAGPIRLVGTGSAFPQGTRVGSPSRRNQPHESIRLAPGSGGEIPADQLTCSAQKLDGSGPCKAPRLQDNDVCLAHARSREKQQRKGS